MTLAIRIDDRLREKALGAEREQRSTPMKIHSQQSQMLVLQETRSHYC